MNIEEMTQSDVDALEESVTKLEGAVDRYKKENIKFRTERDEYKAAAESNEANATFKDRALKAEAKARISALGVKDADRILKLIDLSTVEFGEDGSLDGIDSAIDSVKTDFPEFFDAKRRVAGKGDAAEKQAAEPKKSLTQMQIENAFRKR